MKSRKRRIIKSITGILCAAAVSTAAYPFESRASTGQEELVKQSILEATKLLESAISRSYDQAEAEVKEKIIAEGLDYYMTMESFYRQENPYKDANYMELIAAYATAKESGDTLKKSDFYSLPFIRAEVQKKTGTEYKPMLVQNYRETGEGIFTEDGMKYINGPCETDLYIRNPDGTYRKDGVKAVTPETITTVYGDVTLSGMTADDILAYYGLDSSKEALEAYEKKVDQFGLLFRGRELNESVFVGMNRDLMTDEIRQFLSILLSSDIQTERIEVISEAVQLLGRVPYEWGGKASVPGYDTSWWTFDDMGSQKGLDCSGFVQWAFMTAGFDRTVTDNLISTQTILVATETIPEEEMQPGDLGLLNNGQEINHVGIFLGDGYWIHCSSEAGTVVIAKTDMFKILKRMPQYQAAEEESAGLSKQDETVGEPEPVITPEATPETEGKPYPEADIEETAPDAPPAGESKAEAEPVFETGEPEKTTEQTSDKQTALTVENTYNSRCGYTEEEIYLLAQLIYNEANAEGMNGWIAVAEVVRNRIESDLFPDTLEGVIYQKNPVQFSDYQKIAGRKPSEGQIFVAREVLSGNLEVLGDRNVLYFRNAGGSTRDWGGNRYFTTINNHQFYTNG